MSENVLVCCCLFTKNRNQKDDVLFTSLQKLKNQIKQKPNVFAVCCRRISHDYAFDTESAEQQTVKRGFVLVLHMQQGKEGLARRERRHNKKTPYKKKEVGRGKDKPLIAQQI
jgi:hypothetical protein